MAEQGATQYDLFISHAPAGPRLGRGLPGRCAAPGRIALAHRRRVKPAARGQIETVIAASRRILLILSPAYLADGFADMVALLARQYGSGGAIWPVSPLLLQPVQLPARLPSSPRSMRPTRANGCG